MGATSGGADKGRKGGRSDGRGDERGEARRTQTGGSGAATPGPTDPGGIATNDGRKTMHVDGSLRTATNAMVDDGLRRRRRRVAQY